MEKVIVYASGIAACSACVHNSVPAKEVAAHVNGLNPTGISSKWKLSKASHFSDGVKTNPCPCEEHPRSRKHYLLTC